MDRAPTLKMYTVDLTTIERALKLTERNLSSLIAAKHSDAVMMTDWRDVVRDALGCAVAA